MLLIFGAKFQDCSTLPSGRFWWGFGFLFLLLFFLWQGKTKSTPSLTRLRLEFDKQDIIEKFCTLDKQGKNDIIKKVWRVNIQFEDWNYEYGVCYNIPETNFEEFKAKNLVEKVNNLKIKILTEVSDKLKKWSGIPKKG